MEKSNECGSSGQRQSSPRQSNSSRKRHRGDSIESSEVVEDIRNYLLYDDSVPTLIKPPRTIGFVSEDDEAEDETPFSCPMHYPLSPSSVADNNPAVHVLAQNDTVSAEVGGLGPSTLFDSSEEEEDIHNYLLDDDSLPTLLPPRPIIFDSEDESDDGAEVTPNFSWPPNSTLSPSSPAAHKTPAVHVSAKHDTVPAEVGELGPTTLFHFEWRALPKPPIPESERRERFTPRSCPGPTTLVADSYDAFVSIWNRPIMEHIAYETNKYAQQLLITVTAEEAVQKKTRLASWKPTDADELYVYFALMIIIGLIVRSDLMEYWEINPNTVLYSPITFKDYMSVNRFLLISRCLHFNDNEALDASFLRNQKILYKIQPIVNHLNEKFQQLYQLGQNISIDESLTRWRGGLDAEEHILNKVSSVGIKSFEICEPRTGYLYKFEMYTGSEQKEIKKTSPVSDPISSLVLKLVKGLEHQGHTLWLNNYYTSPALARMLKILGFDCVGTLRTNRLFVPDEIKDLKTGKVPMQKGQIFGCTSGDVDIVVWKNIYTTISTYHGMEVKRRSFERQTKPIFLLDYNYFMESIDIKDRILDTYSMERKITQTWYQKLFRRLLNASVLNAYILYKNSKTPKHSPVHNLSHRHFRESLILELLNRHQTQKPAVAPDNLTIESVQHFTVPYPEVRPGSTKKLRRPCVVCHKRSRTQCQACNVALCLTPCAHVYHRKICKS